MAEVIIEGKRWTNVEIDAAEEHDESGALAILYIELGFTDPIFKHGKQYIIDIEGKHSESGNKITKQLKNYKYLKLGKNGRFFSPESFAKTQMVMKIKPKGE